MGRKKQQDEGDAKGQGRWGPKSAQEGGAGLRARRYFTPEERRQAVEAYEKSGLSRAVFARQWGMSDCALGVWLKKYRKEGPQGLERLSPGPRKPRGKAPLAPALKAEILAVREQHQGFGWKRLTSWLWRFGGVKVSQSSVRRVVASATAAAPGQRAPAKKPRAPRKKAPPRRFERSRPGELWQSDITYLQVPWRRGPLYLIVYLDDFSRYVVGFGLFTHQRADIALDTFAEACARVGKPREVLTDQGRQYFAWRGKSAFTRLLEKEGVRHVVARAQHPETVGKCERLWESLKKELWERVAPKDLEEARERIAQYFAHHNFQRPHQSLDGLVPADRFFGVEQEVRAAIEKTVAKNALRLALGQAPRKPLYLVGQIDGQAVSLHGESGRIVVHTPDGRVKDLSTKDLGMGPGAVATEVEHDSSGEGVRGEEPGGEPSGGAEPRGDGPGERGGEPAAGEGKARAPGDEAHGVPGAGADAGAGAGAVEGGQPRGTGARAPDGGDGAQELAGQEQP